MPKNAGFAAVAAGMIWAGGVWLAALPARAQLVKLEKMGEDVRVEVRMDTHGEATVSAWSRVGGGIFVPVLPAVLRCQGGVQPDPYGTDAIRCVQALRREGLTLAGVVDLGPIVGRLDGSTGIDLWVNTPRIGFTSTSIPMEDVGGEDRLGLKAHFEAGARPPPIAVRFGYRRDELAGVYLPLAGFALALTVVMMLAARAGLAGLSRSGVLLGTVLWMGLAGWVQAGEPLRILLYGSPFANLAALVLEFWPPLLCVAIGVGLGSRLRPGLGQRGKFREVFSVFAAIPLILTCAMGALPAMETGDWVMAACWIAAAPAILLLRRGWIRNRARGGVRQITAGELHERLSALAARARCPQVKIYLSSSARSQVSAAFALPGKSIFLTAPLVRSLSKREVDAVAAHELGHFRHSTRGPWMALGIALVLFETPARGLLAVWPALYAVAMMVPVAVYLAALRGARQREFAADAGAVAVTGDPRAMMRSLARIARVNHLPLEMNAVAEWFSTHPPTSRRIAVLAASARLGTAEDGWDADDGSGFYELPEEASGGAIFTPAWQKANAGVYGWAVLLGCAAAGVLTAWLVYRLGGHGVVALLGGMALGCALTKGWAATVMASNFARLRRRLESKLGVSGQLVGLAMDGEAKLYNGFRFSDAGLLWFEPGRLCYRSERVAMALHPADVIDVAMVAASPSNWARRQPRVRLRLPDSGAEKAFILHPVAWIPGERRLLRSIERWRAGQGSAERSSVTGFEPIVGQPFRPPSLVGLARAFLVAGSLTVLAAMLAGLMARGWWWVGYALAVAACAHIFMFLPALLYRTSPMPGTPASTVTPAP
ncbi:MAG TPA: M48 family metalloprotease [Acidobacteriaceae bacterium]|jgi:Zn-dependent protease with chaperone function|nr:M48 family metalloprotease [Acidobacteriaceae bacterium]